MTSHRASQPPTDAASSVTGRRQFLGYLLAAPTLVAAAQLGEGIFAPQRADAAAPSNPQVADNYDLSDALSDAALPTSNLISVQVHPDGTVSHDMVRTEVGQGVQTAIAMLIAEEMDVPIEKVRVGHAPARPELHWNQLTGGSNSLRSQYYPVRVAAAIAKGALLRAASHELDFAESELTGQAGKILAPTGASLTYGELAEKAASLQDRRVAVQLKPES
jgi:isoquinoline 1-oxidoreductase beta subunit